MRPIARAGLVLAILALPAQAIAADTSRVVSIGGALTEIVFALGAGKHLVAVDTTSLYPPAARKLPNVGYMRQLSAEGVLSLRPSLVLVTREAGPPVALQQLRDAQTPLLEIPDEHSADGAIAKIRAVAAALEARSAGEGLATSLARDMERVQTRIAALDHRPKVLFLLSIGQGAPRAAGRGTTADAMIRLAGGVNAVSGYDDYKPLSPEAAIAAAPDALLMTSRTVDLLGGADAILGRPEIRATPAGRARRLIAMDGLYLLGFGPRLAHAIGDLAKALHPDLVLPALAQGPGDGR